MLCLDEGADWVPYLAGGAGPGGYPDVISPARPAPLKAGDVLMLDTGLVWDGYFCDFDRNWSVGAATEPVRSAHGRLVEACDAAFDLARPGATAADLFHAMNSVLSQGSAGTDARAAWPRPGNVPDRMAVADRGDDTVLEPGMVLTLEPGIETEGGIMVHEEDILITAGAPRYLSPRTGPEVATL